MERHDRRWFRKSTVLSANTQEWKRFEMPAGCFCHDAIVSRYLVWKVTGEQQRGRCSIHGEPSRHVLHLYRGCSISNQAHLYALCGPVSRLQPAEQLLTRILQKGNKPQSCFSCIHHARVVQGFNVVPMKKVLVWC